MKVALYARTATQRPDQDPDSVPGQIARLKQWASVQKHEIIKIYCEPAQSGNSAERPEFRRMMSDAVSSEHPFDAVVAVSLSRFARNVFLLEFHSRALNRANVEIVSTTQAPTDYDARGLFENFITLMSEYTTIENAKHVHRSMCANAQQGFFNGSRAPFGYTIVETAIASLRGKKRRLALDPDAAPTVRTIFALFIQGHDRPSLGVSEIASLLNERWMLYQGESWSAKDIRKVLRTATYTGTHYFNRRDRRTGKVRPQEEWIVIPVPAIVTQEQFDQAAQALKQRRHTPIS